MKRYIYMMSICLLVFASCKKNDPITELGTTNNEFASQLRVSYSNTAPLFGDTILVTASTWQKEDKFQKVVFYETVVERIGITLTLANGTTLSTKTSDEATLTLIDSISKKSVLLDVPAAELDKYWVTAGNNYVVRKEYKVEPKAGKYTNDVSVIDLLTDEQFSLLKALLGYSITRNDYLALFPGAPVTEVTTGSPALTAAGRARLQANCTRAMLKAIVNDLKKVGTYSITIDVSAITPTNTVTAATRTFDINL